MTAPTDWATVRAVEQTRDAALERLAEAERERDRARGARDTLLRAAAYNTERANRAEAALDDLRTRVAALADDPDDTQWWEVVPYMDPPEQDEVVEVQVVAADRLRALLAEDGTR